MKKQLIAICLMTALLAAFAVPAFAATADDIAAELDALAVKYDNPTLDKVVYDAMVWLDDNADSITDAAAAKVLAEIQAAVATVGTTTKITDLSEAQTNKILANATAAANAVGLKVEVSADKKVIKLKDADGNEVSSLETSSPIKQTGSVEWSIVILAIVLAALAVFAVAIYMPKRAKSAA